MPESRREQLKGLERGLAEARRIEKQLNAQDFAEDEHRLDEITEAFSSDSDNETSDSEIHER